MDFGKIASLVLNLGKGLAPLIPGGALAVGAVETLAKLIDEVKPGASPATADELEALKTQVLAGLDKTIDSLGDN